MSKKKPMDTTQKKAVCLITGASASGKTTLQEALVSNHGWTKPTNYTTRKPRNERELDEYVFIDRWQFAQKAQHGDFAEWTVYRKNLYAMTRYFDFSKRNAVIVDPIGAAALESFLIKSGVPYFRVWVEVPERVREERLANRRSTVLETDDRMADIKWFPKVNFRYDLTVDGTLDSSETAKLIDDQAAREEFKKTIKG